MKHYDVIVVGFGTAGSIAAVAAVRQGMKVLVLERTTYGGGTHTGGHICGYFDGEPDGLTADLNRKTADMIADSGYLHPEAPQEIKIIVYEQEIIGGGGEIIYEAWVTDVIMEGKTVRGVIWYDADGRHEASTGMIIDGTADAAICALAGCELTRGRASDGLFQPFTNSSAYLYPDLHVWTANPDAGRVDQTDAGEFSKIMLQTATIHLRDQYTDSPRLITACDLPGLREGPRIVPEYLLRLEDFWNDRCDLSEPIAWSSTFLDNHGNDYALESETLQDWYFMAMKDQRFRFGIPRGAIIPKGYTGLLVAGRHVGVDHDFGYAVRMNGALSKIGEAAGILAALAVKMQLPPLLVPYGELEKLLKPGPSPLAENDGVWGLDHEEIRTGLASAQPGKAIWSARRRHDGAWLRKLFTESGSGSELRCHTALALALRGDEAALPELRRMAAGRDPYVISNLRHRHVRGYVAVYLLGRLRDTGAIEILADILRDNHLDDKFYYHTNAVMALLKIGNDQPALRSGIADLVRPVAEDPSWYVESQLRPGRMKRRDPVFRVCIADHFNQWGVSHRIGEVFRQLDPDCSEMNLALRKQIIS